MRLRTVVSSLGLGGLAITVAGLRTVAATPPAAAPVIIELFTSQGCSSCPPADRLLTELGRPGATGAVIPLAFHVDYWNNLGWTDPFSSPDWSSRQEAYARSLRSSQIYTPQLVVNGRRQCVGSQRADVLRLIDAARREPAAAHVTLSLGPRSGPNLPVRAAITLALPTPRDHPLELWVALTQSGLVTPVRAGENATITLHDDFVVRALKKATNVSGPAGTAAMGDVVLNLDRGWPSTALTIVAFAQDPVSRAIAGASSATAPR
jgi:hypothetical protein